MLSQPDDSTGSLMGGRLCLAIVNTIAWRRSDEPDDHLDSYDYLIDVVAASGRLPDSETLRMLAKRGPGPAELVLARVVELREQLYEIFSAISIGKALPAVSLSRLNDVVGQALSQLQLTPVDGVASVGWRSPVDVNLPLWLIAMSAADLLTGGSIDRVKQCPDERCGWVFFDASRNRSRRWCEDSQCGNRARAKRYYERHRAS